MTNIDITCKIKLYNFKQVLYQWCYISEYDLQKEIIMLAQINVL